MDLIERFERNLNAYRSGHYNEAQLRQEFLNPFFCALGWDVENRRGFAEAYKDVIHEDAIKVGEGTKAPDYCFCIGGNRKFFVEAKKPSVNLKEDPAPAFQLRRYAWSSKLPLSLLTNFAELAVYDSRIQPRNSDKASVARIGYYGYRDYLDRWEEIVERVSKEAILKGSFDRFVESSKLKKGTAEVDDAFLAEIEQWRSELASNIALRNQGLSQRDLNFVVQRTIDRIIFLRICEDRGIEPYGQLRQLEKESNVYRRLCTIFERADERYNSGLFHFQKDSERSETPDILSLRLKIDDSRLKSVFKRLYYPESPYEFSVLPADILGHVYEQFLSKVIRLTPGRHARVEPKPEVRKAGGVYYTPTHIVEYIVCKTVDQAVEGKTVRQVSRLRILDPACGSGSFLISAYQHLLTWHRGCYVQAGPEKHKKELYQGSGGEWRLTTAEKKRILLNNIYGVDIDGQAVEVTKLSLLLKVLEGESEQSLATQLRLFHERALPDLGNNIKCGNSLISTDFYLGHQTSFLTDDEERYRINAFVWDSEFRQILSSGGFDVVIGNPPWGQKEIGTDEAAKQYIWKNYPSAVGIYDMFRPFVERGIRLIATGGRFGMVLPDIVLLKDYQETRHYLLRSLKLAQINWWGMAFPDAVIDAATIIGTKETAPESHRISVQIHDPNRLLDHEIPQTDFWKNPRYVFNLFLTPQKRQLIEQLEKYPKLGELFEIHEGVHSGNIRDELFVEKRLDSTCRELIFGRGEIEPYRLHWNGKYVRLSALPNGRSKQRYANAGRAEWYEEEKVLVRRTGDHVLAAVDHHHRYASNNFFIVFPRKSSSLSLDGLCALLNSKFMTWYFQTIEPRRGRVFSELKIKHLEVFPLPPGVFGDGGCTELNELGKKRAALAKQMPHSSIPRSVETWKRACTELDGRIERITTQTFGMLDDRQYTSQQEEVHV